MKAKRLLALLIPLMAACAAPRDADRTPLMLPPDGGHPLDNIARGRPVHFSPAPDYRHCTDPDDARQLTDGEYVRGYFWTQRGTVGWNRARPAVITVDLGHVEPIRGVSFNTAAGKAGVDWPQAIFLLVSVDGKTWREAGELTALSRAYGSPPAGTYAVHCYKTDALRIFGRHVAFVISTAVYGFVDEIEVYRGETAWLDLSPQGATTDDLMAFYRERVIGLYVAARIARDARAVLDLAESMDVPSPYRSDMRRAIAPVFEAVETLKRKRWPRDFQAVLPLHDMHRRVFRVQAAVWRAAGADDITTWITNAWDPMEVVHPISADGKPSLNLIVMNGETRAGAFNVSNATDRDLEMTLRFEGLPGGSTPDWIVVCEVSWTDTNQGRPVAAALPPAPRSGEAWSIGVPSGMTRQVWLTVQPEDVKPGIHRGNIVLGGREDPIRIPVRVRVSRLRFPERPTLHVGGWDYTDARAQYGITPANREAVIAHLRERHVDSTWATSRALTRGRHADDGSMTAPPDTTRFDAWIARWPDAGQYCIYAAVGKTFDRFAMGTIPFERAVGDWIRFWTRHAARTDIEASQLVLLLVDEPSKPEQDAVILAWAKAIRKSRAGVRIFEDPLHIDPPKDADLEMLAACDILCLHRPRFYHRRTYRDYYTKRKPPDSVLSFYSCNGPVRLLDPYTYHRLQAWACWKYDAIGSYFWAFGDSGGASSWNEYVSSRYPYVPFYLDPEGVTAGKHMEAIREGIEDYEYLVMLKRAIAAAERRGGADAAVSQARTILKDAADRVLGTPTVASLQWDAKKDRSIADRVRIEILDALESLASP
jgi:hypothetical protein